MNLRLLASSLGLLVSSQPLPAASFLDGHDFVSGSRPGRRDGLLLLLASRGQGLFDGRVQHRSDRPLAGVREQMAVSLSYNPSGLEPTVTSSDPAVIDVGPVRRTSSSSYDFQGLFEVHAGDHAGSATITVTQGDGRTSTLLLTVDDAAGMEIVEDEGTSRYFDRSLGASRCASMSASRSTASPSTSTRCAWFSNDGRSGRSRHPPRRPRRGAT